MFQINNQSSRYFILSLHIQGAYELSADSYNIVFPSQKRSVKVDTSVNIIFSNVFVFAYFSLCFHYKTICIIFKKKENRVEVSMTVLSGRFSSFLNERYWCTYLLSTICGLFVKSPETKSQDYMLEGRRGESCFGLSILSESCPFITMWLSNWTNCSTPLSTKNISGL